LERLREKEGDGCNGYGKRKGERERGKGGGRLLGLWEKEGGKGEKGVERL